MELTTNAKDLFVELEATAVETDSYEIPVARPAPAVNAVEEGTELEQTATSVESIMVEFSEVESDEEERDLAREAVKNTARAILSEGELSGYGHDYDAIYVDRLNDDVYVVDTDQFGYRVVNNYDPLKVGYVGLLPNAALRLR